MSRYVDVGIRLAGRTWVTFQVQANASATIGLFFNNTQLSYEIVIGGGGNQYARIR